MPRKIPEHVAEYLLERALSRIPDEVLEALISLSPEQIEGLERVGQAYDASESEHHLVTFSIH